MYEDAFYIEVWNIQEAFQFKITVSTYLFGNTFVFFN